MRATIARRCVRTCAYLYRDCGRTPACSKQMGRCAQRCLSKKLIQAAEAAGRPVAGHKKATAIGVCMPVGVARFVRELRCASGTMPTFKRVGSVGPRHKPPPRVKIPIGNWSESLPPGEADWHIVDRYELRCEDKRHTLYFDIYHCADGPQPWITPKGFGRPMPTPDKLTRKLHAVGAGYRDPPRRPPPAGAKSPK